jgi:hypothetical protein
VVRRLRTAAAAVLTVASLSVPAAAVAGGYGPPTPPGPPVPGGFSIIIASKTFGPQGGTLRARRGATRYRLSIPRGALSRRTQFTLTAAHLAAVGRHLPAGLRLRVAVGVLANRPNGQAITRRFSLKPVQLGLLNRHIAAGSEALSWNRARHAFVRMSAAHFRPGGATIRLRHDAEIAIASFH